jgi:hypothetical protein
MFNDDDWNIWCGVEDQIAKKKKKEMDIYMVII